jgi:hypothetical protein
MVKLLFKKMFGVQMVKEAEGRVVDEAELTYQRPWIIYT